ncbi:hypothetical protein CC78DRAFT_478929, partial [Lojkania enalia]
NADEIRECLRCRSYFTDTFKIPPLWWSGWMRRSNGYFGTDKVVRSSGELESYQTWFRFLAKQTFQTAPAGHKDYVWYKFNVFTQWIASTRQMIVFVFDPRVDIRDSLLKHLLSSFPEHGVFNPYQIHISFLEELARLQDEAVWGIRDLVRKSEIQRNKLGFVRNVENYFQLAEVGRHAIHVSETLEVAVDTIRSMKLEYDQYFIEHPATDHTSRLTYSKTRMGLNFLSNKLYSLLSRSASNKDRLVQEVQLSFNLLTWYESEVGNRIALASQNDSAAMRSITFLTFVFLPATFISAIFSMSFFNFDGEGNKWRISKDFWIYWVITIPVTLFSVMGYYYGNRFFLKKLTDENKNLPERLIHRNTNLAERERSATLGSSDDFQKV